MPLDQRLISAVAAVFVEKGYSGASTRDLASALGLQRGSLYHHIKSKEELLYEVVLKPVRSIVGDLQHIVESEAPVRVRLSLVVAAHIDAFDRHFPHLFVFLQERFPIGDEQLPQAREIAQLARHYEGLVVALITEGMADGSLRDDLNPQTAARALLGMCNWMHKWYRPSHDAGDDIARTFSAIFLDGLDSSRWALCRHQEGAQGLS